MSNRQDVAPDSTAARVTLWRALHVAIDPPPHVVEDEIGLELLAPDEDWRQRGDMDPQFTRPFRASIVARARFIEDLLVEQANRGLIDQYVILGAGLDSFAQRRPDTPSDIVALAREAGFGAARHVSAADLTQRYFAHRTAGLRPPNNAQELLVATT